MLAVSAGFGGCGSGPAPPNVAVPGRSTTTAPHPTAAGSAPASPTSAGTTRLATVPDCGAGAYKPSTLLIVCGVGTTTATGLTWTSWSDSEATGMGEVHLATGGTSVSGQALLRLSGVVEAGEGPQYTVLEVTWTGEPPDGHRTDTFHLRPGSG